MSTFIEAVMALREAGILVLACAPQRMAPHLEKAFEELRETIYHPDLEPKALRDLDEDRTRELARVELEATMAERRACRSAAIGFGAGARFDHYLRDGKHRQSDLTPIIEPGPTCSERGDTVCKRREAVSK